jgi:hypothetical protein
MDRVCYQYAASPKPHANRCGSPCSVRTDRPVRSRTTRAQSLDEEKLVRGAAREVARGRAEPRRACSSVMYGSDQRHTRIRRGVALRCDGCPPKACTPPDERPASPRPPVTMAGVRDGDGPRRLASRSRRATLPIVARLLALRKGDVPSLPPRQEGIDSETQQSSPVSNRLGRSGICAEICLSGLRCRLRTRNASLPPSPL